MTFPLHTRPSVQVDGKNEPRSVVLYQGLTVIIGPNGSGKTQLLRGLKTALLPHTANKHVRYLSAGRAYYLEQFRSDFDGHRNNEPRYEQATYGSVDDSKRRHKYETLQGDFHTLATRPDILVKVRERLRKLFDRDLIIEWSAGNLKIAFLKTNGKGSEYSSAREASGLLHLVGLLSAIYDDEVGALLIDEPEVSLHPQLQAFLLKELLSVAGLPTTTTNQKLIIVATHSTEFIRVDSPEQLPNLVLCYESGQQPIQVSPDAAELKNRKLLGLLARMGQEHKLCFFSKTPLLIEGPSDAIICNGLSTHLDIALEAGGAQLLPVIGKGQFPIVAKLFRMLGKEPMVLADADGLADGLDLANDFLVGEDIDAIVAKMGFSHWS
ncbi:ATP-dependent nuclease [Paraburkholderia sp.]|uniref:ATP-dependent nuclease n=1 Tax=Paraburkholderia sp. TaxID=1926495 RepID=UPI003D6FB4D2